MKASIVDLRYKTTDILKALDRNESVTILYHGKIAIACKLRSVSDHLLRAEAALLQPRSTRNVR